MSTYALRPSHSLQARFAWVMGGTGIALTLLTALAVGAFEYTRLERSAQQVLLREAQLLQRMLSTVLQERLHLVGRVASDPVLSSGLMEPGDVRQLLESVRNQQPEIAWMGVTDAAGVVRVGTGALLQDRNLSREPWFAPGLQRPWLGERRPAGALASKFGLSRNGQAPEFLDVAAPLRDYQGQVRGVVVALIDWHWLSNLHLNLHAEGARPPGTDSLVLDRSGRVTIGPTGLEGQTAQALGLGSVLPIGEPRLVRGADGTEYLIATADDAGAHNVPSGLTVLVRQRATDAFAGAAALRQRLFLGVGGVTLGFVLLSLALARHIARPIQQLSDAARAVRAGAPPDFGLASRGRQDEVADLAQSLHELHAELARRLADQQRSAERFSALFDGAPVAFAVSVDGRLTLVNAACLQLFGASSPDQLCGRGLDDLLHPDDAQAIKLEVAMLMHHPAGVPHTVGEHRIVRLDGGVRDVQATVTAVDRDGIRELHTALRDVTEQRRASQLLADSEDRLQLALRGSGSAVWDLDLRSGEVYFSPTWADMLEVPFQHLQGASADVHARLRAELERRAPHADRARLAEQVRSLTRGDAQRHDAELRLQRPGGGERTLLLRMFLVRDAQARPSRLIGSAIDISDIREARRLLQQREALLARTSRLARVGGFSVELGSGQSTWTSEVAPMLGLPSGNPPPADWLDELCAGDDHLQHLLDAARRDAAPFETELPLPHTAPGAARWVRLAVQPVLERGAVHRLDGAIQDVSQRREAEEAVRALNAELELRVAARTAELYAANAELDGFVYAVSHDLRAPLRAMSGFSQALLEDHGAQLAPEARSFLDQIIQGSRRMGDLIDGLLALSRSTLQDVRREAVDISALVHRAAAELRMAEPSRTVRLDVAPGLTAHGDPRMLDAVVRNLVGNAWKYTQHRADATITVRPVQHEGRDWIEVSDNGAGFDMAHAGRLFKPFSRLHRQDEFPGLGIGLATVQRIVQRHGGLLQADGRPGAGATLRFSLPAPGQAPSPPHPPPHSPPHSPPLRAAAAPTRLAVQATPGPAVPDPTRPAESTTP